LILVFGIFVSLTLLQPDQGTAVVTAAPGLPASSAANPSVSGLAGPDAGSAALGLIAGQDGPLAELDPVGAEPGMKAAEDVAVNDSAELDIREEGHPAPGGGPGEGASFQDGADLLVRDAEGNIKQQEKVN
jgi:hypothetical protein